MSGVHYLYKIVNCINEKVYVGITKNPEKRWKQHKSPGSACTKLKNAMKKHGVDSFKMQIICIGRRGYIVELESKAIMSFNSIENGYNLRARDDRTGEYHVSKETRDKMSAGIRKYYSQNPSKRLGSKVNKRSDDYFVYVSGFWFPNRRLALDYLRMNEKTFYKRKSLELLGM